MNRHYPKSAAEVLESYEFLLKDKLRDIDHMTRQMFRDLQLTGQSNQQIREMLTQSFWDIWEQVAAEEEVKTKRRVRE